MKEQLGQFIRYCIVGVLNTLVTLGVIYLCKSMHALEHSFPTRRSSDLGAYRREALRFVVGFGVCYALQFVLVWMLTQSDFGSYDFRILGIVISGYGIATLLGNIVYTLANFVFNRLVTFR